MKEEFEVQLNEKPCKVVMESLTFGQRNEALKKSSKVDLMTQQASIDSVAFTEWRLVYTIKEIEVPGWKEANEVKKLQLLKNLPLQTGDALSKVEQKLNLGITEDDKKK